MSDEEANRIIAEFMGLGNKRGKVYVRNMVTTYTESLDAQIPVWEKLDSIETTLKRFNRKRFDICGLGYSWIVSEEKKTIQQSSAHALVKAILALKEQGE